MEDEGNEVSVVANRMAFFDDKTKTADDTQLIMSVLLCAVSDLLQFSTGDVTAEGSSNLARKNLLGIVDRVERLYVKTGVECDPEALGGLRNMLKNMPSSCT